MAITLINYAKVCKARSWLGHRAREANVHAYRLLSPSRPISLMVFPGGPPNGGASGLRGWNIARQLRFTGFRTIVVPPQLELLQRRRIFEIEKPNVVLFQKCRDPLHDPIYFPGSKYILDMDDADFLDPNLCFRVKSIASRCDAIIAGSRYVANWLLQFNPNVRVIWTGSHLTRYRPTLSPGSRSPIVGYAVSNVLNCPQEACIVIDALRRCARSEKFVFRIQSGGNQEAIYKLFEPVVAAGSQLQIVGPKTYNKFVKGLEDLSVGLAPLSSDPNSFSAGKSFGKILAYLAADVPVVTSDAADHSVFFRSGFNGYIAHTADEWADAIIMLLRNPSHRDAVSQAARKDFTAKLSLKSAAQQTATVVRDLCVLPDIDPSAQNPNTD